MDCNTVLFGLISLGGLILVSWEKLMDFHYLTKKGENASADMGEYFSNKGRIKNAKRDSIRSVVGVSISVVGIVGLMIC